MFQSAQPVWLEGRSEEMNLQVGFRASIYCHQGASVEARLTGSTLYRVYINGHFVHYGPVRGPHGYARVDRFDLTPDMIEGINEIAIEVAGYNCPSYYTLNLPSFLQAEIMVNGKVVAATGESGGFRAAAVRERVQNVMRYSFQRTFSEVYRFDADYNESPWTTSTIPDCPQQLVPHGLRLIPRELPIPAFSVIGEWTLIEQGKAVAFSPENGLARRRFIDEVDETIKGYPLERIDRRPFEALQTVNFEPSSAFAFPWPRRKDDILELASGDYVLLDLGCNRNGFIQTALQASEDSVVYLLFDEKLIDGKINVRRWESINVIELDLKQAEESYRFESFESYGFRYLQIFVPSGKVSVSGAGVREYACPLDSNASFVSSDETLNQIFAAARETYRQNTVDVFMDCPTRERAGWLCDSYFTAQAAALFSGDPVFEKVFLENFVLAERFPELPEGMLPMCYPADHVNGNFIPQWAMWYVIELEGYLKRNPEARIETFRDLCYRLIAYFEPFRNSDGLLEKLDKWNFIEWSKANQWVQDVNYPTNMLYSRMLRLIGEWFDDAALLEQADQIKATIVEQSFDGFFFQDNAVRDEEGRLVQTGNRSEVCQYYAFFFGMADPEDPRFSELLRVVLDVFGPDRKKKELLPEIAYANAFIGNYLRMELLLRWRRYRQALEEVKGYFAHMALLTGTLWEHDSVHGSLNHGFASYAGVVIIRCLMGLQEWDTGTVVWDEDPSIPVSATAMIGTRQGTVRVERSWSDGTGKLEATFPPNVTLS